MKEITTCSFHKENMKSLLTHVPLCLVVVDCLKYFVRIFPAVNAPLCSRTVREQFLSYFFHHTDVVSCPELMPLKHANNFRVQPKVPEPFLHQELSFCPCSKFLLHVSPLRARALSSGTLRAQEFFVTIAIIKESRMKFMILFERSSSKHKFILVAMMYFLFQKICCKIFFLKGVLKWKTLSSFLSPYPSKVKTKRALILPRCHVRRVRVEKRLPKSLTRGVTRGLKCTLI